MGTRVKFAIALLFALSVAGCTLKPVQDFACDVEKTVTQKVTDGIVGGLECEDPSAVYADIHALVHKVSPCPDAAHPKGLVSTVCTLLVNQGVEHFATKPLPVTWKCKATNAKAVLKNVLQAACQSLPMGQQGYHGPY